MFGRVTWGIMDPDEQEKRLAWKYLDCSNLVGERVQLRPGFVRKGYPANMEAVFTVLNNLGTASSNHYDEEARVCLMGVPAAFFYLTRFTLDTMERDEHGRAVDAETVKKALLPQYWTLCIVADNELSVLVNTLSFRQHADVKRELSRSSKLIRGGLTGMAQPEYVEGRLLDGFLLLAAGGSGQPEGVITVNLSSLQIVDIAEEDLTFFSNLDRVDLSDNQLGYEHLFEQITRLPRLGTLNLACNSISTLQVGNGILQSLEVLDLSFNGLHGDVLGQLARLPSLVWLNLASNCISSLPPEAELVGLQALEELILDSNDLVQFMQWRSLDAVPHLRKLSLMSNRVKRLKDDAPDTASGTTLCYFPRLEELDLSSNEITGVSSLPVIQLFQNLRVLRLTDNPCTRGGNTAVPSIPHVAVVCEDIKPFYMKGNGCFAKAEKIPGMKLKMDSRKMKKVRDVRTCGVFSRPRSMSQLGELDEEANALVVQLSGTISMNARAASAPAKAAPLPAAEGMGISDGILSDDLTEEELDQIFRERKQTIENRFEEPVEEPSSFMKEPEDAATKEKLAQLMKQMRQQEEEQSGVSQTPKEKPSGLFLTGLGEDAPEPVRQPRRKLNTWCFAT
ncbi:Xrra1 [Symbiodinium pilosum]|uniref:Xrra1 protein n=1 Tax=Symbiodinium pilosum TaxID=2952 RepID=A0A812ITK7_SYMPI|nr:Xrra1 [Symbiodinium pilosum]